MSGFLPANMTMISDAISETTATANTIPRSGAAGTLDPSWAAIAEVVSVAKAGASYTSLKAALDYITALGDASATKPYSVRVYPGVYNEDPMTLIPYVSIRGFGATADATIHANNDSQHLFTVVAATYLEKLTIKGPVNEDYACVYTSTAIPGAPFFINDCAISDGYYGIWADNSAASISTQINSVIIDSTSTTIKEFIKVSRCGNVAAFDCQSISNVGEGVKRGVCIIGADASIRASNFVFSGMPGSTGVYIDEGATVRINSSTFLKGSTAIHVGPDGTSLVAFGSANIGATPEEYFSDYNILIESPTAQVSFNGKADKEKIEVAAGANFTASFLDVYGIYTEGVGIENTPGQVVFGELWLGTKTESIPMRQYSKDTFYTGWASGGDVTRKAGLVVTIDDGYGYVNTGTGVVYVNWSAQD